MIYRFLFVCCVIFGIAEVAGAQDSTAVADTVAIESAVPLAPETELAAQIQAVLAEIEEFAEVDVVVRNGVVKLSGTVVDAQAEENVLALAQQFEGVLYVDNDIEQATDIETRVTPAVSRIQSYWDTLVSNLPVFGVALLILLLFWWTARRVHRWTTPFDRFGVTPLVQGLVRRVLSAVLFAIGLVLALDVLGVTALVGAVLGTAGVLGIAVGFAFQDIVENYLAGILLSVQRPFDMGDLVLLEGQTGAVVRMTARELVLMTPQGNHVRLSNATVFKSTIVNYSRNPRRRFEFVVGIGTEEDLSEVRKLGLDTLRAMPGVLDDPPPFALIEELGDSTVSVRFFGWVDQRQADFGKVKSEAIRLIKETMDEAGVQMPEPIYRVMLRQLPDETAPKPPVPHPSMAVDVSVDTVLEEQVRADLRASEEPNLLESGEKKKSV